MFCAHVQRTVHSVVGQFPITTYQELAVLRAYGRWAELDQDRFRGYSGAEIRNGDELMSTQKPGTKQTQFPLDTRKR